MWVVNGLIMRICIDEGQKVRKGETLFVIDQVPYKAALVEVTANVKNAEAKFATARLNIEVHLQKSSTLVRFVSKCTLKSRNFIEDVLVNNNL